MKDETILEFMKLVSTAEDFSQTEYEISFEMLFNMLNDRKLQQATNKLEKIGKK
jgi:hypothetical protein